MALSSLPRILWFPLCQEFAPLKPETKELKGRVICSLYTQHNKMEKGQYNYINNPIRKDENIALTDT